MKNFIALSIWVVVLMIALTEVGYMLTYSSNIVNVIGFIVGVLFIVLSIQTKCFTSIKINKKQNESNEK
jgi:uncharacterized membrane protein YkvI|nr:MAG TPA: hypothetical protein [Crassvirales sp.]